MAGKAHTARVKKELITSSHRGQHIAIALNVAAVSLLTLFGMQIYVTPLAQGLWTAQRKSFSSSGLAGSHADFSRHLWNTKQARHL